MRCYKRFSTIITKEHAKTLQFIISNELFLSKDILKTKKIEETQFLLQKIYLESGIHLLHTTFGKYCSTLLIFYFHKLVSVFLLKEFDQK